MRQQVEGLRDLMAPFDFTFVAAVKVSSERAMPRCCGALPLVLGLEQYRLRA